MPDWVQIAIAIATVCVLLYLVARSENARANGAAAAAAPPAPGDKGSAPDDFEETSSPVTVTTPTSERFKAADSARAAEEAHAAAGAMTTAALPKMAYEEDADVDPTKVGPAEIAGAHATLPVMRLVYDSDAERDEPTQPGSLILVSATAQTDKGARRRRNEDSVLVMSDEGVFAVADGMGGYRGGEIASELAVKSIEAAFRAPSIAGDDHADIPRRASELVRAVQLANEAILRRAEDQKELAGMGTTICAARFSVNKQRLYVAHVGDSRMYRARNGELAQMTSDHTMEESFGVKGEGAAHLSRALGLWPSVPVDVILGKPQPRDVYLICSDGLTKMLDDSKIADIILTQRAPTEVVDALVAAANASGGKDNITVILIRVYPGPKGSDES